MPLATQTKLLRVLEQREFHRVGGEASIQVDVRIVAATNQDLRQLLAIGDFRRDLYFRLNVLSIELPALRERRQDIPLLVEAFVREVSERNEKHFPGISPEAMEILMDHSWPGNIRELRNLVESMVVLAPGRAIRPEDIPDEVRGGGRALLPVPLSSTPGGDGERLPSLRPELEFIFRTLVELRVDMDELKREFEAYRTEIGRPGMVGSILGRFGREDDDLGGGRVERCIEIPAYAPGGEEIEEPLPAVDDAEEETVVYRSGMTIEEMEREAIALALKEVAGNRRKAAEMLGIGERTLYRKIAKYDLES
ncbi:MAG: AAA-type ATPase lid domain-containing protein [Planctomycetota bacterium]|jgi:DNA-binding NtrC family response regulator